MQRQEVSKATLARLPAYLTYLKSLSEEGNKNTSATAIAEALGLGDVQVRKDLAAVSGAGRPKTGYVTKKLISDLEEFLKYHQTSPVVMVGCGSLGHALLGYRGFEDCGLKLLAGFDVKVKEPEVLACGRYIYPMENLEDYCRENNVKLAMLAVPSKNAQEACNQIVAAGIKGILNFAPTHLIAPSDVVIKPENLAVALAALAFQTEEQ